MESTFATATSSVNSTIKISVCGNLVKEGGEDCDNADLDNKTCQELGFGSGVLRCDISCSFDTSACTVGMITETPQSTESPQSTPKLPESVLTPTPTVSDIVLPTSQQASSLPSALQTFDINGVGYIEASTLYAVVKVWVEDWKNSLKEEGNDTDTIEPKKCDINNDRTCNMQDFSVLMFYIER